MLSELGEGWAAFRSRNWLWAIVAQFATYNALCFAPFMVLGAVVARNHLGGASAWGAILASFGAGSITGGVIATRLHPRRPLVLAVLGAAVLAAPLALIAAPASVGLIAAGAALAGVGLALFGAIRETARQQNIPTEVLSRVSAYDWFGSVAFVPLGYILAGPLAAAIGIRTTLFLAAGWAVLFVRLGARRSSRARASVGGPAPGLTQVGRGGHYQGGGDPWHGLPDTTQPLDTVT